MGSNRNPLADFLTVQSSQIDLNQFLINLLLTAVLAFVLGRVYAKFGVSLSNRELFARNFVVLAMTTMLIITIVKSSLALSLGLVGALSIIRFRAAIKEPEELNFLFLAISLGLGFGAGQTLLTCIAFVAIVAIIAGKHFVRRPAQRPNFFMTIASAPGPQVSLPRIMAVLQEYCPGTLLTRLDETPDLFEACFRVQFDNIAGLSACQGQLMGLSNSVRVSYLEERGLAA